MNNFTPTSKQHEFFQTFGDKNILEVLYGGAAGGGKTFILCSLLIFKCLEYPGIIVGLGRNNLSELKSATMTSFYEIFKMFEITDYNYNSQSGFIKFPNGSEIRFFSLQYFPSDPDYVTLQGQMLTFGAIEEAGGVDVRGKAAFQSRLGRWMNDEYDIQPQLFMTCNPSLNFLYQDFYRPYQKGELEEWRKFIPAFLSDNPYIGTEYERNLKTTQTGINYSRLLLGEWDFDQDKARLLKYDDVLKIYDYPDDYIPEGDYYISADIAFTSDKCIILLWKGLTILEIINYKGEEPELEIIRLRDKYNIDPRKIVYDSDGVGKYLKGKLRSAFNFINNGKPLYKGNYDHIKSQVYFKLSELILDNKIKVMDMKFKEELIQEVYEMKSQPLDSIEGKLKIVRKKDIVKSIGRSPDISDAIAYRMVFELREKVDFNKRYIVR